MYAFQSLTKISNNQTLQWCLNAVGYPSIATAIKCIKKFDWKPVSHNLNNNEMTLWQATAYRQILENIVLL